MGGTFKKALKFAARSLGTKAGAVDLKKDDAWKAAAVLALRAAVSMGRDFYQKPGVQANVDFILGSEGEHFDPSKAETTAKQIAGFLKERQICPSRIGVDGLPGSGKSTLARALADQMGMLWKCLDHQMSHLPVDLGEPNTIYEHHRLLRTQDISAFDVLVFLDEPVSEIKKQIISRGRGAVLIDVLDFDRMQKIGRKAFDLAGGEEWHIPDTHIRLKLPSPEGFGDCQRLDAELGHLGFTDTESLTKEAKIFLAVYGRAKKGSLAYVQGTQFLQSLLLAAVTEVAGSPVPRQ